MKNKFAKTLQITARFSSFILIGVSMLLYVIFSTLTIHGDLPTFFSDWKNILWVLLNMGITIALHQIIISTAVDNATTYGLETLEFKKADTLNGLIINEIGSKFDNFIDFVKALNILEKKTMEDSFIQSCGKKSVEDLDEQELKEFNKLRPVIHDIKNFLRPCYVEIGKNGKISYDSSYTPNHKNLVKRISKVVFSLLMGVMTLGPVMFGIGNIGMALLNTLMTSFALLITFITVFVPIYYKLRYTIPKKVYNKGVLVNTYKTKNGTILIELAKYQVTPEELGEIKTTETEQNVPIIEKLSEKEEVKDNAIICETKEQTT